MRWMYNEYFNVYVTGGNTAWSFGPVTGTRSGVVILHDFLGLVGTGYGDNLGRTITHKNIANCIACNASTV